MEKLAQRIIDTIRGTWQQTSGGDGEWTLQTFRALA